MKGSTMIARISAGGEHADAVGRAGEQRADSTGTSPNRLIMNGCKVSLQERREHEQAPDAVDDAGNAGQQLDRDADRPAQPERAQLGQEHRDAEPDGTAISMAMNEVTSVP